MKAEPSSVRQSVTLPAKLAAQVRSLAKARKVSANRVVVELVEIGIETEKRKEQHFFALAERFRNERDSETAKQLGEQLGQMVFGS